jgi:hypothetical protein
MYIVFGIIYYLDFVHRSFCKIKIEAVSGALQFAMFALVTRSIDDWILEVAAV